MHWLPWWCYPAACCVLTGMGCGWLLGYAHRGFIEWGRRGLVRRAVRAYRELWRDVVHLCATGRLRPGRRGLSSSAVPRPLIRAQLASRAKGAMVGTECRNR